MTDTPQQVKDLQLKIWLSKTPAERLQQLMMDNEAIFNFWAGVKPLVKSSNQDADNKKAL